MARHEPPFAGIWPAMVTPFDSNGQVNLKRVPRLVTHMIDKGSAGLYVGGSTGEAPLLQIEERRALAEAVIQEVAGCIPVIIQVGQTSPLAGIELAKHARRCGADGISSVIPPFYPSYSTGQIIHYWSQLGQAGDLPFYGYVFKGFGSSYDEIARWVEAVQSVPNLVGMKFTNPNTYEVSMLKYFGKDRLNLFSGMDECYLACKAHGADGAIGASYNIALPMWLRVKDLAEAGDFAAATEMMITCDEVVSHLLKGGQFLDRIKAILKRQGVDCGLPRQPLRTDTEIPKKDLDQLVELIDVWNR